MECKNCNFKNKDSAKYCEKCGTLLKETKIKEPIKKPKKKLPLGLKLGTILVIIIVVLAIILLSILLKNPLKEVEDYISKFYATYNTDLSYKDENNIDELIKIGNILKSNKNNEKVILKIENEFNQALKKWVANFNTTFKNQTELENSYQKVEGIIKSVYNYFNGSAIMSYKEYRNYIKQIEALYKSKINYLEALELTKIDAYQKYKLVIDTDIYYQKAQEFINDLLKTGLEEIKEELIKLGYDASSSTKEKYTSVIKQLEFLRDNKIKDGIDYSDSLDYQEILTNLEKETLEYSLINSSAYSKVSFSKLVNIS